MKHSVIILLLFSAFGACAQPRTLDDFFLKKSQNGSFNGSVLIAQKGQILLRKGYGYSHVVTKTNNTPETLFRIGSLTKQFTAALILVLESQKLLKTDDKIAKYLPDYPNGDKISISDLVHHTSGIPNFIFFADYEQFMNRPHTTAQMMARFQGLPLEFAPGSAYNYSNSGYFLLGVIIEKVTGLTFEEALKMHILKQTNLSNTGIYNQTSLLATGYKGHSGVTQKAPDIDLSVPYSAGAMYSTVDDLYRWQVALQRGFLPSVQRQKQLTPLLDNYGYGLWIDVSLGQKRIWHTGGLNGFRAVVSYYPASETTIIVLCNMEKSDIEEFEVEIAEQIFKPKKQ